MAHCGNKANGVKRPAARERVKALAEIFEKSPEVEGRYEPLGKAEPADHNDRSVRLRAGSTSVEVTALAPNLFRVGMFPEGRTPDYRSEAIAKEDWEPVGVGISGTKGALMLSTAAFTARARLDPLRISFTDSSGTEFAADDEELG
jgi:alpha-glucosidase